MKVESCVILAGGLGTRLSEETGVRPKPMVEIGGMPIIWHIMKNLSVQGIEKFIICLGYKGYQIKEYFSNYALHTSDVTINMRDRDITVHHAATEPWQVTLVDTGEQTMTGGRLGRIQPYVNDSDFIFTYGDGLADIDFKELVKAHTVGKRKATLTAVLPPGRYGALSLEGDRVTQFQEKPPGENGWVNGGFFVLSPSVFDYLDGDTTVWEQAPLQRLASEGELTAHFHSGFWQPMDTLRERNILEDLWRRGEAPWKNW